ncbi:MAG: MSMEG_1061 family FMN-dependent PPOX-type flavoprotein, partial [Bacteroidota bacterium]
MKIKSTEELRAIYGHPKGRAVQKSLTKLDAHCQHFIQLSPFLVMSSASQEGRLDASPRGGKPGFVQVLDAQTLLLPDAKGNKRLDSLFNIVETGQLGLLFFLPGVDETLRINGKAHISTDLDLLARFSDENNPPQTCLVIAVEEAFLHCAKALMRSQLWDAEAQIKRSEFP